MLLFPSPFHPNMPINCRLVAITPNVTVPFTLPNMPQCENIATCYISERAQIEFTTDVSGLLSPVEVCAYPDVLTWQLYMTDSFLHCISHLPLNLTPPGYVFMVP
jgi:hypothetical protein